MTLYFKNTNRDITMNEEDEKHYRNNYVCLFFERNIC